MGESEHLNVLITEGEERGEPCVLVHALCFPPKAMNTPGLSHARLEPQLWLLKLLSLFFPLRSPPTVDTTSWAADASKHTHITQHMLGEVLDGRTEGGREE